MSEKGHMAVGWLAEHPRYMKRFKDIEERLTELEQKLENSGESNE